MKRDPSRKLDPETMLALAKARQRQERRSVSYLIAVAVLVLGLGVIGWFLWPEDPPRVTLAAYDAVATPEESIVLQARAWPEAKGGSPTLSGLELWFQTTVPPHAETVITDSLGGASLSWQAPKTGPVEFMVRHQQKIDPKKPVRDNGRVFVWPPASPLLVVDVDHALTDGVESLAGGGNVAPTLREGAAHALQSLSGRYKIIYLSTAVREPTSYKKLRAWLQQAGTAGKPAALPGGPLIGPSVPIGEAEEQNFAKERIGALKKRFTAPAVGVAWRDVEAQMYLDAGWKAVVIGPDKIVPPGASAIQSWANLPKELTH